MTYLAVILISIVLGAIGMSYFARLTLPKESEDLSARWEKLQERLHDTDEELAKKIPADDYANSGFDQLR